MDFTFFPSLKSPPKFLMNRSYKRQFDVNLCKNRQTCGLQSLAFPAIEILVRVKSNITSVHFVKIITEMTISTTFQGVGARLIQVSQVSAK